MIGRNFCFCRRTASPASLATSCRSSASDGGSEASNRSAGFASFIQDGNFFGFGDFSGPKLDHFEGRFGQVVPPKKPDAQAKMLADQ